MAHFGTFGHIVAHFSANFQRYVWVFNEKTWYLWRNLLSGLIHAAP